MLNFLPVKVVRVHLTFYCPPIIIYQQKLSHIKGLNWIFLCEISMQETLIKETTVMKVVHEKKESYYECRLQLTAI